MLKRLNFKETFIAGTPFKYFLLSILVTGLSYGLYKGMLDNFLAEVVKMGEMGRGVTEFFRELLVEFDPTLYTEIIDSNNIKMIS